ncbi:MAG: hypothetical protein HY973_01190 [Candidatus Kerfeldbacteria bacterium]|nr:hypothetical protein [Candidatus Kerfeldbacteria bacterium]
MLKTATAWKSGTIKTPQVKRRCGELAANYGYLKTYIFRVRSYTSTELFSELKTFKKQTFSTLNHWQKQRITEQHIRQNILKSLSPKIRNIALAMTKVVYLREQRVGWWGKITTAGYPLITECARRLGLTYDQFFQLTETEFLNQRFRLASINKRSNGYAFVAIGDKATIKLQKFQPPRSSNLKVVKGVTVSPGTVQGPVQFADAYTFPNLKRGAILVTAMTTPDSVPYLKRVKAIVTDEGGATAHAAIIARELKIPCVIGTKIATKVFHSGDIVEVRGVEGIVKLIKKFNQTGL